MTDLTILHVDDEPDIREVAEMSLRLDPGIDVVSVSSGRLAITQLEEGLRPDIILLDVMMPDMDGPATLAQIRKMPGLDATPVIFMTARAQSQEQNRYLELGAHAVVLKPFDPMTLAGDIRDLLVRKT